MPHDLLFLLTLLSALGCALMAGVFFAFSAFVMNALARLPAPQGIAAMQSINVAVLNPWFAAAFFGTPALSAALAAASLPRWHEPGATFLLSGSAIYLVGSLGVTIACHLPRNAALAAVDANSLDGVTRWAQYVPAWTTWNHVRAAASLAAAALFTLALCEARPRL